MKTCALLLAVCVVACASSGHKFTIAHANQVKNGMTREEVITIMHGKPNLITDGGKTFVWSYAEVNMLAGVSKSRAVRFSFDEDGKTYGVPQSGVYGDTEKYR